MALPKRLHACSKAVRETALVQKQGRGLLRKVLSIQRLNRKIDPDSVVFDVYGFLFLTGVQLAELCVQGCARL